MLCWRGGSVSMDAVVYPTPVQQKQACWEAGRTSSWLENSMQWKQLARAGRRKVLLSKGDPVGPAEGKSWHRNRKQGRSTAVLQEENTHLCGFTGVRRHGESKVALKSYCYTGSCSVMLEERRRKNSWGLVCLHYCCGIRRKRFLKHSSAGFLLQGVKYFQMGVARLCCEDNLSSQECWPQPALVLSGCLGLLTYL